MCRSAAKTLARATDKAADKMAWTLDLFISTAVKTDGQNPLENALSGN
jgi:hypothetical protein